MSEDTTPINDLATEGHRIRVRVDGPESGPPLVLAHMLGTDLTLWDGLLPALERFRVIRFDMRGHGGSDVGEAGFGIERLGQDVLDILDDLEIERAHFCGQSMGGAVGLWLLAHAPDRIDRAVIAGASAKLGTPAGWNTRIATARAEGMDQTVTATMERFFSPAFAERSDTSIEPVRAMIRATSVEGYANCCAALRDMDLREAIRGVTAPVLVLRGADDPSVSAGDIDDLVAAMESATSVELDARHCASIEDRDGFAAAVVRFLTAKAAPRRRTTGRSGATTKSGRGKPPSRRLGGRSSVAARHPIATKTAAAKVTTVKVTPQKPASVKAVAKKTSSKVGASNVAKKAPARADQKAQPTLSSRRVSSKPAPAKAAAPRSAKSTPKKAPSKRAAPPKATALRTKPKAAPKRAPAIRAKAPTAKAAAPAKTKVTSPRKIAAVRKPGRATSATSVVRSTRSPAAKKTGATLRASAKPTPKAKSAAKAAAPKAKASSAKATPSRASATAKPAAKKPVTRRQGSRKP